jgi:hypothetical protein
MHFRHRGKPPGFGSPRIGRDGTLCQQSLERIAGLQRGDGGDGGCVASGTLLRGVAERRGQFFQQQEDRVSGDIGGSWGRRSL